MPLIVEDGTGLDDANAYIDATFADAYHAERGNAAWAALDAAAKEVAIIKATDFLARYSQSWIGMRKTAAQMLDWPRIDAVLPDGVYELDDASVPIQVQKATAELALRASVAPLAPDQSRGGAVKRRKVGPIEVEYETAAPGGTTYPSIDFILSPLLGASASIALVRS